jgi:formate dehydrogenase subunit beta
MNRQWLIKTYGDPLGAVRRFIQVVWQQPNLDGMLVPMNGAETASSNPRLLHNPAQLNQINPFKPLMTMNTAILVPNLVRDHPQGRFGAIFRPCEMRALIEMVKHDSFKIDDLLTIGVDCLATLPADEYHWRAARKEAGQGLTQEALQFVRRTINLPGRAGSCPISS